MNRCILEEDDEKEEDENEKKKTNKKKTQENRYHCAPFAQQVFHILNIVTFQISLPSIISYSFFLCRTLFMKNLFQTCKWGMSQITGADGWLAEYLLRMVRL